MAALTTTGEDAATAADAERCLNLDAALVFALCGELLERILSLPPEIRPVAAHNLLKALNDIIRESLD